MADEPLRAVVSSSRDAPDEASVRAAAGHRVLDVRRGTSDLAWAPDSSAARAELRPSPRSVGEALDPAHRRASCFARARAIRASVSQEHEPSTRRTAACPDENFANAHRHGVK